MGKAFGKRLLPPFAWLLFSFPSWGQADQLRSVQPLITQARIPQAIDESISTILRGNTHRLARREFDRGAAPGNLPMDRMLLVLRRSPEQESSLTKLLDEQQDKSSPSYHKWLTPEEFGKQFGASDEDVQVVTAWLQSHGFQVANVARGRTVIEFSGTAAQVQEAFHTAIHKYVVGGEEHWANANDPQIPTALAPVVAGVHTLHNFLKKPMIHISDDRIAARVVPAEAGRPPKVTFPTNPPVHALAPADFATIYGMNGIKGSTGTGSGLAGARIGVVARSNINVGDVQGFDSYLPLNGLNVAPSPFVILNGPDPGDLGGGEEAEAVLDASWSGALLAGTMSTVELVVSASTNTTDGVDLSQLYIVDSNSADIMTESFGICEAALSGNSTEIQGITNLAQQAAAQGITYIVAAGDSGAEGCDNPNIQTVATGPVSVNILAATPYNVAVGGTMFNENGQDSKYWASTNAQFTLESALSYIPEDVWNESCTFATCGNGANIAAGGGGASTIFSKPTWQSGVRGIPNDGARDVPDISLAAAAGHDPYLLCLAGSCVPDAQGFIFFYAVGGTSASSPAFAGIMALVDNATHSRQGQANYVLYQLAAGEPLSQCNASNTSALPASTCTFSDVTQGNNVVPGEVGTQYQSGLGYDLATGLGSVKIANLANNWSTINFSATTTTIVSVTPTTITHGQPINVAITVSSSAGTPTGSVSLATTGPILGVPQNVGTFPLAGGSFTGQIFSLPGSGTFGEYVTAQYGGDTKFAPSPPSPSYGPITVNPEPSNTALNILSLDSNFNFVPFTGGAYGSFVYLRADVSAKSHQGVPTGNVNFLDGANSVGVYPLNSQGNTATPNFLNSSISGSPSGLFTLAAGGHSITANYNGDLSFQSSVSSPVNLTITPATTTTTVAANGAPQGATLTAMVNTSSGGNAPTGTVTFSINGMQVGSPVQISGSAPATINPKTGALLGVQGLASFTDAALANGQYNLTATYSGDSNYTGSASLATPVKVQPDFVISANTTAITVSGPGGSGALFLSIAANDGFAGTVQFSCAGLPAESTCNFSPATIATSGTTTVTVTTSGPHQVSTLKLGHTPVWMASSVIVLGGMLLIGLPGRWYRWTNLLTLVTFVCLLANVGCGGGNASPPPPRTDPGTPSGTSNVIVTAASGSLNHSVSFTLIVQ